MSHVLRVFVEGLSVHVIQRGLNRMPVFKNQTDYDWYLWYLHQGAERNDVAVHGFALMTNHIHAIVTPTDAAGLSAMMQHAASEYARHFNRSNARTGAVWNARYKSPLIEDEQYWLTCLRYIEQNPVRAGIVAEPGEYRWSSYQAHAFGNGPSWLTPHDLYTRLGSTAEQRQEAYRAICGTPVPPDEFAIFRRPHIAPAVDVAAVG